MVPLESGLQHNNAASGGEVTDGRVMRPSWWTVTANNSVDGGIATPLGTDAAGTEVIR